MEIPDSEQQKCIICNRNLQYQFIKLNIFKQFFYCDYCYHIQSHNSNTQSLNNLTYKNRVEIYSHICDRILETDLSTRTSIKVLLLNGTHNFAADTSNEYIDYKLSAKFLFLTMCDAYNINIPVQLDMKLLNYTDETENEINYMDVHDSDQESESRESFDIVIINDILMQTRDPKKTLLDIIQNWCSESTYIYTTSIGSNIITHKHFYKLTSVWSVFNVNSMKILCDTVNSRNELDYNIELNRVHLLKDTNYVFELHNELTHDTNVTRMLLMDVNNDLYSSNVYDNYKYECEIYKNTLCNLIMSFKINGYKIIGYSNINDESNIIDYCLLFKYIDKLLLNTNYITDTLIMNDNEKYAFIIFSWQDESDIIYKIRNMCYSQGYNPNNIKYLSANIYSVFSG